MAYEHTILPFSWPAGADLSAKQYYALQLTTVSGAQVVTLADATVRCIGILQNEPLSGEAADVCLLGISRAIVDAHGGSLWAEIGDHGLFKLILPVEGKPAHGDK